VSGEQKIPGGQLPPTSRAYTLSWTGYNITTNIEWGWATLLPYVTPKPEDAAEAAENIKFD